MPRQLAYIVCGNAGTGKTTFAKRLAAELGAALIDIDSATERLAKLVLLVEGLPSDDRDSPEYKAILREPIYETLFDIAVDNLDRVPCVIVGPFTRERRQQDWPERLSKRLRTRVKIFVLYCRPEVRQQRLLTRANPRDRAKLENWSAYAKSGIDREPVPFEHDWVDTSDL